MAAESYAAPKYSSMSDLPGEITKQSLSAPPLTIRSTRNSLTAQGRSTPSAIRLPTGRSSFEKASGCMRLPRPAAGIIPHMLHLHRPALVVGRHDCVADGFQNREQLQRAFF